MVFTPYKQKLLIFTLDKGVIHFKNQGLFTSIKYYCAISYLKNHNLLKPICQVCYSPLDNKQKSVCGGKDKPHRKANKRIRFYSLSTRGTQLAKILKELP